MEWEAWQIGILTSTTERLEAVMLAASERAPTPYQWSLLEVSNQGIQSKWISCDRIREEKANGDP